MFETGVVQANECSGGIINYLFFNVKVSNENTQYTNSNLKKKITLNYRKSAAR